MDIIEKLVEDWIQIRTTLKGQLKHFEDGSHLLGPGLDSGQVAAEAKERIHRCISEIEILIRHYH